MDTPPTLYQWLFPIVPFEFIAQGSPDECASLLAGLNGMRSGPTFFFRLKIDLRPAPDQGYEFIVKRHPSWIVVAESHGSITAVAENYARVEGVARTKPTLWLCLPLGAYFCLGALLVASAVGSGDAPSASLVVVALISVLGLLTVLGWKWTLGMYTDMVLGTLLRALGVPRVSGR